MIFNEEARRYELEPADVEDNVYRSPAEQKRALRRQSRSLYQWIYANINRANKIIVDELLQNDPEYVRAIREALIDCYEADSEVGFSDLKYQFGDGASYIDEHEMVSKLIPASAKAILRSISSESGHNIFYAGFYWIPGGHR